MAKTKIQKDIEKLYNHAEVANKEMGLIRNDIEWIKDKFLALEKRFDKLDERNWWILATIILGTLVSIAWK